MANINACLSLFPQDNIVFKVKMKVVGVILPLVGHSACCVPCLFQPTPFVARRCIPLLDYKAPGVPLCPVL